MSMYHAIVIGIWVYALIAVYLVHLASTRGGDSDPPDTNS